MTNGSVGVSVGSVQNLTIGVKKTKQIRWRYST
jgi:hypothetical protein